MPALFISNGRFHDEFGREIALRGINVDAGGKNPAKPEQNSHVPTNFYDGDPVSFVNRPFPLREASVHFARLRSWGYNTIRWIFTWEAIEHAGPGQYDDEFVEYTVACLRLAQQYEMMVIMDPHQDTWSRFSGGDGAPMWTLYACGLDPKKFPVTEAALVQNTWADPAQFPKMIWATNYYRLACQVMFTLFWAGRDFAPKAIIGGQNIQDYLQGHFIGAVRHLAQGIAAAGDLLGSVVIGWETINEPNRGLVGIHDITVVPKEQVLQKGTSPTAWQAMLLGSGRACEVEVWDVGGMGPHKTGSVLVDPRGETVWLSSNEYDRKYNFQRDSGWRLGTCVWAQHGVWDPKSDEVLRNDYFATDIRNGSAIDYLYFTNRWFLDHFRAYRDAIRTVYTDSVIFLQPPTLEVPPSIKDTTDQDGKIVLTLHWYDGLTLMNKKWNSWWNVDVFGVLRGKYLSPAFAIKIGERAIRACFQDQLSAMRKEGLDQMGMIPCVLTETGIPFDLNQSKAYETGDYSDQVSALDAVHFGIEGSGMQGYTLWNYTATNNHEWGDNWNGEDLSIVSLDDSLPSRPESGTSLSTSSPSYSQASLSPGLETPTSLKRALTAESMTLSTTLNSTTSTNTTTAQRNTPAVPPRATHRALSAHLRPWPRAIHGRIRAHDFSLASATFTCTIAADTATGSGSADRPSEFFLPAWHFPAAATSVTVSGGKWTIVSSGIAGAGKPGQEREVAEDDAAAMQVLRWWHAEGEQKIQVKGLVRAAGASSASAEDGEQELGYLQQCRARAWRGECLVM